MEINERPYEERLAEITDWIKAIGEIGKVADIDPVLIKGVIEEMGANIEISEEAKKSLARYSNLNKRPGLDAVWGTDRVDAYKEWVKMVFIPGYEQKVGKELHTLWDKETKTFDNVKHSGMMQFLGELTAFALGQMSLEDYRRLTEDRVRKGIKFESGDPYEPYKPSPHSSFPPEFPVAAWNFIKST